MNNFCVPFSFVCLYFFNLTVQVPCGTEKNQKPPKCSRPCKISRLCRHKFECRVKWFSWICLVHSRHTSWFCEHHITIQTYIEFHVIEVPNFASPTSATMELAHHVDWHVVMNFHVDINVKKGVFKFRSSYFENSYCFE